MTELMQRRDEWSTVNCSIARSIDLVGNRTALLILREAFFGTRRFDDFAARVGVSEPAAAARLRELTSSGLLERVPYQEPGQRTRYEYRLTEAGRDFLPVIVALRQWGDRWAADDAGPSVIAHHRDCGAVVRAELRCEKGHKIKLGDMRMDPGPGLLPRAGS